MEVEWLKDPVFQRAMGVLTDAGFDAYAVGGCVRDAVIGVPCNDVDIATNATPDQVYDMMKADGFRMVPIGPEHGTWGVRRGGRTYEVTTYRQDVSTDGRRATVEFADTMEEDAARRDFTMNALYMDKDGKVLDPTGEGLYNLHNRRVKFVGNAEMRCQEDLLRIMRLFRFFAKYGGEFMDFDAFQAAEKYADQIVDVVSGERIWDETKKLMSAPEPELAITQMHLTGVAKAVYGTEPDMDALYKLRFAETQRKAKPQWHRRYLALFGPQVPFPASKQDQRKLQILNTARQEESTTAVLAQKYGKHVPFDRHLMRGYAHEFDSAECHRGFKAKFPLDADDMMEARGLEPGPAVGEAMRAAKKLWYDSDLQLTRSELLEQA